MHLHYLTLARQAEFLNRKLSGHEVIASFTQRRNEWVLSCRSPEGDPAVLQLSCDAQYPSALWLANFHRAKVSTDVLPELIGLRIAGIEILPGERILDLRFQDTDLHLLIQLFTGRSNFFLVDRSGVIRNSFKAARRHIGQKYEIPLAPERHPVLQEDAAAFQDWVAAAPAKSVEGLLRRLQLVNRTVIREVLHRTGLSPDLPPQRLSPGEGAELWAQLRNFLQACRRDAPRVYLRDKIPEKFALTELQHLSQLDCRTFDEVNEALRFFLFQSSKYRDLIQKKQQSVRALERKISALRHHLSQLKNRRPDAEKARYLQKCGELLTAQPQVFRPGARRVTVVDYFDPEMKELEIEVDPQLSAQENAAVYFRRAKQQEKREQSQTHRAGELERQLEEFGKLLEECRQADDVKTVKRIEEKLKSLHLLQSSPGESEELRRPYKTYFFRGWEIRVGRSARDNDALTFQFAKKEDFWLHVQGDSGSHVILRNPERRPHPPDEVLRFAAALAVTFSQAKHASYVPVLFTQVKYVRKPRKSPPGTAIPTRTKTIYVDPLKRKDVLSAGHQ